MMDNVANMNKALLPKLKDTWHTARIAYEIGAIKISEPRDKIQKAIRKLNFKLSAFHDEFF